MSSRIDFARTASRFALLRFVALGLAFSPTESVAFGQGAAPPRHLPPAATPPKPSGDEYQRKIDELEKELEAARVRIKQLEQQIASDSGGAPASAPGTASGTAPASATAEFTAAEALTSQSNFLRFAQQAYAIEFTQNTDAAPAPGEETGGAAIRFQRHVEKWSAAMTREWRKPIRWLVHHGKTEVRGDGIAVRATVIDEATGAAISDAFDIVLDAKQARRYAERVGRFAPAERWVLTAVFVPRFIANTGRMDEGVFNSPPFVGPGVELRTEFVVESFVPAKEPSPKGDSGKVTPSGSAPATPASPPEARPSA